MQQLITIATAGKDQLRITDSKAALLRSTLQRSAEEQFNRITSRRWQGDVIGAIAIDVTHKPASQGELLRTLARRSLSDHKLSGRSRVQWRQARRLKTPSTRLLSRAEGKQQA